MLRKLVEKERTDRKAGEGWRALSSGALGVYCVLLHTGYNKGMEELNKGMEELASELLQTPTLSWFHVTWAKCLPASCWSCAVLGFP